MIVDKIQDGLYSLTVRGRYGVSNGLGLMILGWNGIGINNKRAGVYQTRPRPSGQMQVKMKHAWPYNPQTTGQQAWRAIFAQAVSEWHILTESEKHFYNTSKHSDHKTGFNRFVGQWLRDHRV